jgi:cytidylate kinase
MDFKISEALVSTVLQNLKNKRRYHHAFSVISEEDGDIYDITIDRQDFKKTLKEALPKYELEEKYEECIKIQEAINSFQKNNDK